MRCHCCCCSTSKLNKWKPVIFKEGGGGRGKYLNCMRCVLQVVQRSREAVRVVVWSTLCQKRKNTDKRSSVNSVEIGNAFHTPTPTPRSSFPPYDRQSFQESENGITTDVQDTRKLQNSHSPNELAHMSRCGANRPGCNEKRTSMWE